MTPYVALWAALCLGAVAVGFRERGAIALFTRAYWRFLCQPWKLLTFALAATGLTFIAPYTGDPTWDHVDALFMAVFTFTTAPWSIGVLYKVARRQLPGRQAYVALCVLFFSASWSYDLYLLLRDHRYPITWAANLIASSCLYTAAGLFWNLAWTEARGQGFAFWEPAWPAVGYESRFDKLVLPALGFMAVVGLPMLVFIVPYLARGGRLLP